MITVGPRVSGCEAEKFPFYVYCMNMFRIVGQAVDKKM